MAPALPDIVCYFDLFGEMGSELRQKILVCKLDAFF